jgi:hypothetical protein
VPAQPDSSRIRLAATARPFSASTTGLLLLWRVLFGGGEDLGTQSDAMTPGVERQQVGADGPLTAHVARIWEMSRKAIPDTADFTRMADHRIAKEAS